MQINRQDDPAANTINGQVGTTDAIKPRIEAGSNAPAIDRARMYEVERSTQTEITMRANELEGMFEAMADGVCIYDTEGNIVHANNALRELLGVDTAASSTADAQLAYDALMFPGNEQGQLLPREKWPVSRILTGEVLKEIGTDIMICLVDGREVILNVTGSPLRDAQGRINGAITMLRDVTERHQLEMRTREALSSLLAMAEALVQFPNTVEDTAAGTQEQALITPDSVEQQLVELTRSILGCLSTGIASVEPETGIIHSVVVAGLSPEHERQWWLDLQNSTLADYLTPQVLARLYANEEVLLDFAKDSLVNRSNYGPRALLIVPIHLWNRFIGILGIEQSNKKHRYTEEELALIRGIARMAALVIERQRLLQEQAQARAGELALREINQRMNEFLSIASHELRTPLAVVKGNVQLAQRRLQRFVGQAATPTEQMSRQVIENFQKLLEEANSQTKLLDRLVSDLLDSSRSHTGQLTLRASPCDLAAIVRAAVEEQSLINPIRSIRLQMMPEGAIPLIADSDRIKQVMMNYLNNALIYSEPDWPVEVELKVEGREASVSVRDQGPGLAEEELKRVWERFYRVKGTSQGGLGLGLHICNMIIRWHGGQIGAQSTPGKGSTFWFTLPLVK